MSVAEKTNDGGGKLLPVWPTLGLVALVLLAMGRVLGNDFSTWDDPHTLYQHVAFNPPEWGKLLSFWDPRNVEAGLWVPVTYTLWGLLAQGAYLSQADDWGARLNPAVFHAASLAVHVISTLLVFVLVRRVLVGRERAEEMMDEGVWSVDGRAWLGAAVFAVHPLQVESVAWTSGMKDVLWGMWALAAVVCYMKWVDGGGRGEAGEGAKRRAWWWAGLACFVLGTLSKPTAMVTPALAFAVHALVLGGGWRGAVRGTWAWFVFVPVVMVWTRLAQPGGGVPTLGLPMRPLIALDTLAFYAAKVVWPVGLAFDYGRTPAVILESGAIWWTWVVPVVLGAAAVWVWRRGKPQDAVVPLAGAWFVIACSPVLGMTPFLFQYFSTVSDHYVYASMAGVAMLVGWGAGRVGARGKVAVGVAVGVVLAFCVVRSVQQMGTWRDSDALYAQALKVNPRSFATMTNIGGMYLYKADRAGGGAAGRADYKRAMVYYDRAVATREDYSVAWDFRAVALLKLGEREEGIRSVRKALELSSKVPRGVRGPMMMSNIMMGQFFVEQGRLAEGLPYLEAAKKENEDLGTLPAVEAAKLESLLDQARGGPTTRPVG